MKSKKVTKATQVSDDRMLNYAGRLRRKETTADEFPAEVVKAVGSGRFNLKNMMTNEEIESVKLSQSLQLSKGASRKADIAIRVGDMVLVQAGQIAAKIDKDWQSIVKRYWDNIPNDNIFNSNNNGKTRKNRK